MIKPGVIVFVGGLVLGGAFVALFSQRKPSEAPMPPATVETPSSALTQAATLPESDLRELARLRAEVTRLKRENSEFQRISTAANRQTDAAPAGKRPAFQYAFLSRDTWSNVGFATPSAAIQTFLAAFSAGDAAALARASAVQTNGEPFVLTGMSTDWAQRVMGAQILSIAIPDPRNLDLAHATLVTETRNASDTGEVLTHGVVTFRLYRQDAEWRFAGKVR